jgi:hypothetical protein
MKSFYIPFKSKIPQDDNIKQYFYSEEEVLTPYNYNIECDNIKIIMRTSSDDIIHYIYDDVEDRLKDLKKSLILLEKDIWKYLSEEDRQKYNIEYVVERYPFVSILL